MNWDWAKAVERNSEKLKPIIAALFAMLGLTESSMMAGRIPRELHRKVLRILRPAEAAVRRLIVIAARGLEVKAPPSRPMAKGQKITAKKNKDKVLRPIFKLEDSRAPMLPPVRRGKPARFGPRIHSWPYDTFFESQRIKSEILAAKAALAADGRVDGSRLSLRLQAIAMALGDLPKQAKRLARWKARRERIAAKRLIYTSPLLRRLHWLPEKSRHEAEDVLRECQLLAWAATHPDTS